MDSVFLPPGELRGSAPFPSGAPVLIVNPAAGGVPPGAAVGRLVRAVLGPRWPGVVCASTATPGACVRDLVSAAVRSGVSSFAVWGGDGTVSAAASALASASSAIPLGIVPGGSGDGAARGIGVPLHLPSALRAAFSAPAVEADLGSFSGRPFLSVAGVGFDAEVARRFAYRERTGQAGYRRAVRGAWRYRTPFPLEVRSSGGDVSVVGNFLFAAFCRGSVWGGRFRATPPVPPATGQLTLVACDWPRPAAVVRSLFAAGVCGRPASDLDLCLTAPAPSFVVACPGLPGCLPCHAAGEFFYAAPPLRVDVFSRAFRLRVPPPPLSRS